MFSRNSIILLVAIISIVLVACGKREKPTLTRSDRYVLLVRDTTNALSSFDSTLLLALEQLAHDSAIILCPLSDSMQLSEEHLPYYSSVVMLQPVEDSLRLWQRTALERYVEAGNGIIAVDNPQVTPMLWHWYQLLLRDSFPIADTASNPVFEKLAFAGGRIARFDYCYSQYPDSNLITQVADALQFATGSNSCNYKQVKTPPAPEFSQFTRKVLDDDLFEPMEMEILPFGEVLFLERRGKMKLYDPSAEKTRVVAEFDVCTEGNYEDGLHGLALDPGYGKSNYYIYLYYSPPCDTPYQFLSRFVFKNQQLERDSEIVMLKVKVQRETCCHSGGSLEFGPDSLLYLSTGDNTSSKESDGFTPTDERPGRSPYDAQKSSGNTHDLRGKIIRIKPLPDGTYAIPAGNLFPADGFRGRPEIYAMGCRNPFRISIDPQKNVLYWGDVGPDGGQDGRYGPQSYDEFNQAIQPGFFGWPYFVGNNKGYPYRNFATDSVGLPQDPAHPVNFSPNNDGNINLPPAQPAMIWYPYSRSNQFPLMGEGSRSALAGPFYYTDKIMPTATVRFPDYYVGKWFIYEWARSWIKVVTFDSLLRPVQIEPFMPNMELSKPIDLKFGPNGALYILEYGNMYFMDNPDARLVKIEFAAGNRPPEARLAVTSAAGAAPHTAHFSAMASYDLDRKDSLCYEWFFTRFDQPQSTDVKTSFTFNTPGRHRVLLRVIDNAGEVATAESIIQVGNAAPTIALESPVNSSFYFGTGDWPYHFQVKDEEDDKTAEGIDADRILVNYTYISDLNLKRELLTGAAQLPEGPIHHLEGARLIKSSDCYSCHHEELSNIGPSFKAIAKKYNQSEAVVDQLAAKVIKGGNGAWGQAMMSAHPQLDQTTAKKMVQYVLSLGLEGRLPLMGRLSLREHANSDTLGIYVVAATYRDMGFREYDPVSTRLVTILRPPRQEAEHANQLYKAYIPNGDQPGAFAQVNGKAGAFIKFNNIDLKGIRYIRIRLRHEKPIAIQVKLDNPAATPLAAKELTINGNADWKEYSIPLPATTGFHQLYICMEGEQDYEPMSNGIRKTKDMWWMDWIQFATN